VFFIDLVARASAGPLAQAADTAGRRWWRLGPLPCEAVVPSRGCRYSCGGSLWRRVGAGFQTRVEGMTADPRARESIPCSASLTRRGSTSFHGCCFHKSVGPHRAGVPLRGCPVLQTGVLMRTQCWIVGQGPCMPKRCQCTADQCHNGYSTQEQYFCFCGLTGARAHCVLHSVCYGGYGFDASCWWDGIAMCSQLQQPQFCSVVCLDAYRFESLAGHSK